MTMQANGPKVSANPSEQSGLSGVKVRAKFGPLVRAQSSICSKKVIIFKNRYLDHF